VQYAPGMRVLIRDEEWLIKKVDFNSYGNKVLNVVGISSLVKDKEAIFLDDLETITAMKPEDTKLIADQSPFFAQSRLYIESLWRQLTPTDDKLHIGHRAAMNLVPYQLDPALIALERPRQRILIADSVGLGKTLEAGILISELIARGRGRRILVVTVKSMMTQFQKELWNRFSIPLVRLDSAVIQKIRAHIPTNHNPFHHYDKTIVSVDTLKRDSEYRNYLENATWDIIVIDEAHNVAERGKMRAQRSRLAGLLSERSDSLIMLSATPHDGKAESFASLMNMLDPTAIANPSNYTKNDIKGLCIRRFKKDIQEQVGGAFRERTIAVEPCKASAAEETAFENFVHMKLKSTHGMGGSDQLFKTILEKSLFSSPAACIKSIEERIKKLRKDPSNDELHDIQQLENLEHDLQRIVRGDFSRYRRLIELLRDPVYAWNPKNTKDRVVVFTERIESMRFLLQHLAEDLHIPANAVQELYGGMSDVEQQRIVEDFGRDESTIRILVASDVASEGINLHYLCHRLIHFDIPWSLMVFQQRNGRIDRYGQSEIPDIRYLMTVSSNEKIHGDMRILEILIFKEEQAVKNIGDPAALMKVYDIAEEEAKTAQAIQSGMDAEVFDKQYSVEDAEFDPLALLLAGMEAPRKQSTITETVDDQTIFSDLDYIGTALRWFTQKERTRVESLQSVPGLEIELTHDLLRRMEKRIPREAMPNNNFLRVSTDKEFCMKEMQRSLQVSMSDQAWPKTQYLWPLHPLFEWANDKAGTLYGRQEAPVLGLTSGIRSKETIFIVSGLIPNRKGNPMVHEWFGLRFNEGQFSDVMDMREVLTLSEIDKQQLPNTNRLTENDCQVLAALLPTVVKEANKLMRIYWQVFKKRTDPKLNEELDKLSGLQKEHYEQISLFETERKRSRESRRVDDIFDRFVQWVKDTLELDKSAFIQVIAVLTGVSK